MDSRGLIPQIDPFDIIVRFIRRDPVEHEGEVFRALSGLSLHKLCKVRALYKPKVKKGYNIKRYKQVNKIFEGSAIGYCKGDLLWLKEENTAGIPSSSPRGSKNGHSANIIVIFKNSWKNSTDSL